MKVSHAPNIVGLCALGCKVQVKKLEHYIYSNAHVPPIDIQILALCRMFVP